MDGVAVGEVEVGVGPLLLGKDDCGCGDSSSHGGGGTMGGRAQYYARGQAEIRMRLSGTIERDGKERNDLLAVHRWRSG